MTTGGGRVSFLQRWPSSGWCPVSRGIIGWTQCVAKRVWKTWGWEENVEGVPREWEKESRKWGQGDDLTQGIHIWNCWRINKFLKEMALWGNLCSFYSYSFVCLLLNCLSSLCTLDISLMKCSPVFSCYFASVFVAFGVEKCFCVIQLSVCIWRYIIL